VLNAIFGVAWFRGSVLLGVVYDRSVVAVAILSLVLQLLAIPFLVAIMRQYAQVEGIRWDVARARMRGC
jgi:predicted MFS family arabinose efflux permease